MGASSTGKPGRTHSGRARHRRGGGLVAFVGLSAPLDLPAHLLAAVGQPVEKKPARISSVQQTAAAEVFEVTVRAGNRANLHEHSPGRWVYPATSGKRLKR